LLCGHLNKISLQIGRTLVKFDGGKPNIRIEDCIEYSFNFHLIILFRPDSKLLIQDYLQITEENEDSNIIDQGEL
jgi:hypothetical protein